MNSPEPKDICMLCGQSDETINDCKTFAKVTIIECQQDSRCSYGATYYNYQWKHDYKIVNTIACKECIDSYRRSTLRKSGKIGGLLTVVFLVLLLVTIYYGVYHGQNEGIVAVLVLLTFFAGFGSILSWCFYGHTCEAYQFDCHLKIAETNYGKGSWKSIDPERGVNLLGILPRKAGESIYIEYKDWDRVHEALRRFSSKDLSAIDIIDKFG